MDKAETYCIRVEGHLEDIWSEWFDGMTLERMTDGTTTLIGPVVDQAALHGLLLKLHNMGLALITCDRISSQNVESI